MTQDNDDRLGDTKHDEHAHALAAHRRSKGGPATLLMMCGVMLWMGAAALMSVPVFVPQYAWIFRHAAKHGVTSGPLLMFGLCLFGLGFVARAIAAPKDELTESQERLRYDQISGELALVRDGLDAARADLAILQVASQSALEVAQAEQANAAAENRQDAIFRLAASLDQVGARLDQRVQAQQSAIQSTLQELGQSIQALQDQMKHLASSRALGSSASQLMGRAMEKRSSHAQEAQTIAHERAASGPSAASVAEPSLGLLDSLDDFGHPQTKESPRLQIAGDAQHARAIIDIDAASAAQPHAGSDQERARRRTNGAHDSHASEFDQDFSTRDKLELLRSLMDDARVREALGSLTGSES